MSELICDGRSKNGMEGGPRELGGSDCRQFCLGASDRTIITYSFVGLGASAVVFLGGGGKLMLEMAQKKFIPGV